MRTQKEHEAIMADTAVEIVGPDEDAVKINAAHRKCATDFLNNAIEVGRLLIEAKRDLAKKHNDSSHGKWIPWIEKNCEFTRQTATGYMRMYEERERVVETEDAFSKLSLREALKLIAAPKGGKEKGEKKFDPVDAEDKVREYIRKQINLWPKALHQTLQRVIKQTLEEIEYE